MRSVPDGRDRPRRDCWETAHSSPVPARRNEPRPARTKAAMFQAKKCKRTTAQTEFEFPCAAEYVKPGAIDNLIPARWSDGRPRPSRYAPPKRNAEPVPQPPRTTDNWNTRELQP